MAKKDDAYIALIKFVKEKSAETGVLTLGDCRNFLAANFPDLHQRFRTNLIGELTAKVGQGQGEPRDLLRLTAESYFRLLEHMELEEARSSSKWALWVAIFAIAISTLFGGISVYQQFNADATDCPQAAAEPTTD